MNLSKQALWERFQRRYFEYPEIGLAVDLSRMNFSDDFFDRMKAKMDRAFEAMQALEAGAIANPDENRMVGHYWLRNPELAPTPEIREQIEQTVAAVKAFAANVHSGEIQGERGPFKNLLVIGIGGSALGTQLLSHALGHPLTDKMEVFFFDNTDPDGMDKVLSRFIAELGKTLCLVVSKSGGTKETRNGMIEAQEAWRKAGFDFARHAVAVTGELSSLDIYSKEQSWLARFPMWDWVGGRTSIMSAVGLLPAALQGFDIDELLRGARECDEVTRQEDVNVNPSALLALAWLYIVNSHGEKDMVVLPYKDRLETFSRYLQQLIMESLGKRTDLSGAVVHQGLSVYGNKGSTDQHAYVQQLRDGLLNFFALFIEVLRDRYGRSVEVEPGLTSGDYLSGYLLGTRRALFEAGRESITLTLNSISPHSLGVLIALFERAVGFYASLIDINAYHQPGVEAGKRAADEVVQLKGRLLKVLIQASDYISAVQLAKKVNTDDTETVFKVLEHLAGNPESRVEKRRGATAFEASYKYV